MPTSISAITGLQNLPNLQSFDASDNYLESIDFSGLTNLTYVRLEDQDFPEGGNSLTSVNVTGCTALEYLDINDADFSAGFPDLSSCTSLQYFDADGPNGYEGSIDLSNLPALKGFDLSSNSGITEVIISSTQPLGAYIDRYEGRRLTFEGCSLTQTAVDNILVQLASGSVSEGNLSMNDFDGETNAIPSFEVGVPALRVLASRDWSVSLNDLSDTLVTTGILPTAGQVNDEAIAGNFNWSDSYVYKGTPVDTGNYVYISDYLLTPQVAGFFAMGDGYIYEISGSQGLIVSKQQWGA